MFVATTCFGAMMAVAVMLLSQPSKIDWHPLSVAALTKAMSQGNSVLILVEGHAGGSHQYFVAEAQLDSVEFRQFVYDNKLVAFRINRLFESLPWNEFGACASITERRTPFLMLIRKGRACELIDLDPNASTQDVIASVRAIHTPMAEE
jgi:hypothetical protein